MMCGNVSVMRRRSDSFLNATQILKVAGIDKGRRTKILEKEVLNGEHEKVQGGYGKYQGTWIPFQRGVALAKQYEVDASIKPLLDFEPATVRNVKTQPKEQNTKSNSTTGNGVHKKVHSTRRKRGSVASNSNYSNDNSTTTSPSNTQNINNSNNQSNKDDTNNENSSTTTINKVIIKKSELKSINENSNMSIDEEKASTKNAGSNKNTTNNSRNSITSSSPQPTRKKQRLNNNNKNNNINSNNNNNSNNSNIYDSTQPSINMVQSLFPGNVNYMSSKYQNNSQPYPTVQNPTSYPLNYTITPENVYSQVPRMTSEKKEKIRASLMEMFLNDDQTAIPDILTTSKLGADDINMVIDDQGHTALHWAATLARINILKLLIEKGADIKSKNIYGETALIRAVISTHNYDYKSFSELLNLLQDTIIYVDYRGRTLLHHIAYNACKKDRTQASYYYLEILLEKMKKNENIYNVIIDFKDQNGDTALNIISRIGNKPMIDLLVNAGADPEIENNAGISPLYYGINALKKDLSSSNTSNSKMSKDELILKTKAYMNSANEVKVTYPSIREESNDIKENYFNPNESLSIKSKSSKILFAVKKAVDEFNESYMQEIKTKDEQLKETQQQLKEITEKLAEARSIIENLKAEANKSNEKDKTKEKKENKEKNDNDIEMEIDKEKPEEDNDENNKSSSKKEEEIKYESDNKTDKKIIEQLKKEIEQLKNKLKLINESEAPNDITMKEQ
jgi:ankyrin repeat protein